ncbi:MAG: dTDP-glucose 4,6-dehydratase [Phycisphaerales bacterium]|nr:dTDP-glucose 4,6-dehydratase [Phycisphaerales bacterium]
MTRHVLITGGCGFIGSNFVRYVRAQRPAWRITNIDKLTEAGNLQNLADVPEDERYRFVMGDICDAPLVGRLIHDCTDIVHLAAETHVDRSIMDARPFIHSNVLGTQTILDAALRTFEARSSGRLVFASTDEVYGSLPLDRPDLKFTEDSPLRPNNPYSASKAAADMMVRAYHETFGLDCVVTRCCNNFGPNQFPEKVIPLFVTNLLEGKHVPLYGDGKNVRDWIHVEDYCSALLTMLERGQSGATYNVGANNERSNLELTRELLRVLGQGPDMIRHVADRLGHDRRYAIDATKLETELSWQATRSAWPEALERTVRWYQDNESWWRAVKSGVYKDYYRRQYGLFDEAEMDSPSAR